MQPVAPGLCQGYARSPAVPGECLAALLAHPVGRQPLRYRLVLEGNDVGCSPAPAGLLRPWYVAGGPRSIPGYAAAPSGAR